MKVLVVKTSSLGDVIHTLPALTDAAAALPGACFDWVVEEDLAEVPAWHPAVRRVIPIALRRWRRAVGRVVAMGEVTAFLRDLRSQRYDLIVDAQGLLIKSALVALLARGPRAGLDRRSAREPLSSLAYGRRVAVARNLHAVARVRRLFALALGYSAPESEPDYGIGRLVRAADAGERRLVLLHGTTWRSKHWPEVYWTELARMAGAQGLRVRLPWGSSEERARAQRIARQGGGTVLPATSLSQMAEEIATAAGVVGVDTGLGHLAAALEVPAVTIYGATSPGLTGSLGRRQRNLSAELACSPCLRRQCAYRGESQVVPACYGSLPPERVWRALKSLIGESPS